MVDVILYKEEQVFLKPLTKKFLVAVNIIIIGFYMLFQVMSKNTNKDVGYAVLLLTIVFFLLTIFLQKIKLETTITATGIHIKFSPLVNYQFYSWSDIAEASIRTYNPINEYGGWGVRFGPGGTAFNTSGNIGLQLIFKNKSRVLIGTQQPQLLAGVLLKMGRLSSADYL